MASYGYMGATDYGSTELSKARRTNLVSSLNSTLFGAVNRWRRDQSEKAEGNSVSPLGDNGRGIPFVPGVIWPGTWEYVLAGIVLPGQGH